ncbi:MAG: hypothetical protein ABL999_00735 [Pyrinomonadaceae bacterium]
MIYSDRILSQKLESAEAKSNADFVETRARLFPESRATWIEVGGAFAMFDGAGSPCTQTFGLGMFDEITGEHLEQIEAFFAERGAPVFHEVSPLADPALMPLLNQRGYQPIELSSVLYRELDSGMLKDGEHIEQLKTRAIEPEEIDLWARTSAAGWATEHESLGEFMFNFGQISARCEGGFPYLAALGGAPIATGMLFTHGEVAMLAGASTVPEGRRQGAQNALLHARLAHAADLGCALACMGASPGSQSQKNAQRNGFNIAYTRTKWQLMR